MKTFLALNGNPVDDEPLQISLLDRGFLYGDGLFETLRVYGGRAFRLAEHVERLTRSAARLNISLHWDVQRVVEEEIRRAADMGVTEAFCRFTLSRGSGLGLTATASDSRLYSIVSSLPSKSTHTPANFSVCIARGRRNEFSESAGMKITSYVDAILALEHARSRGFDDAIFLDTRDHVSEATASNVFIVAHETIMTPPVACGALPGITRQTVIELAQQLGLRVEDEAPLAVADLENASEMFLTSSVRELAPVYRFGDKGVTYSADRPITKQLTLAYSRLARCT
jgi:branched-chain amino acid aminotransferase